MIRQTRSRAAFLLNLLAATALSGGLSGGLSRPAGAQTQPDGPAPTLMRYPNAHGDRIVFVAHGNLWTVPKSGGTATRLTADPGQDMMPRFSPDGRWIAFTASYQGNQDVYVIPAAGGEARRLTFRSDVVAHAPERWGPDNMVVTWTPDSKNIVFMSRRQAWNDQIHKLYAVPVTGGLPTPLPLDRAGFTSFGPDEHTIAYTRMFRDFRTWKRYDGGRHQNVFTYDFRTKTLTQVTDWKGTDTSPMWVGRTIYFLSDRDAKRRANIWAYDLDSRKTRAVTHFTDDDIDFPSFGGSAKGGTITFQQGGRLWALDVPSDTLREVKVAVPDDGTRTGPRWVKLKDAIRATDEAQDNDYAIAPNGQRALFAARGDLFTVPAEHGGIRNLSLNHDADTQPDENHPAWSPDGRWIAYTTDSSGEQQVAIRPSGGGPEKQLTQFENGFLYTPVWSPDGRTLAVPDGNHRLWLVFTDGRPTRQAAQDPHGEIHDPAFSPDGRWLAFSTQAANQQRAIHLYEVADGRDTIVSGPMNSDFDPAFSADGRYLVFVSGRHELPVASDSETNIATLKSDGIYVATLAQATPSPFAPRSDEGLEDKKDAPKDTPWQPGATAPLHVDLDGLMDRAVPLPVEPADIAALDVRGDKVFYETQPPSLLDGTLPGEKAALHVYDLGERHDEVVVDGLDSEMLSADGARVLYKMGDEWHIADAKAGHPNDHTLKLDDMRALIHPRAEWAEMFENAWRLERDLFVNAAMNGSDWQAVHDSYAKLLPLLGSRADLTYLIGQVQGELGNSHTYVGGGDAGDPDASVPTEMLGVDYALDKASGRYRFAHIYEGDNTRKSYRSPLTEPGVDVQEGDYLLAVNGQELRAPADPDSLFVGLQGPVTLTVAASLTAPKRTVTVEPIENELKVREHEWIAHNRERVDRLSGGRIGYIYLSDMESLGMEQFIRQFYPQLDKQALIIDDRWNGGGFIDQIVLERLRRVLVGLSTNRERVAMTVPQQMIEGPKITLLNHYSSSDGDIFPYYFRKYGLGKLVGTRSWGGVRGIRGTWPLLDGGYITVPEDSLYDLDGSWNIENHGVDPDVSVEDVPDEGMGTGTADGLADRDTQLETAVRMLNDALGRAPHKLASPPPLLPAYPKNGEVPPFSH